MNKRHYIFSALFLSMILSLHPVEAQKVDAVPDDILGENTINQTHVVLRALDKITARITELEIPIGQEERFGTLAISVKYCRTRSPIEPPETFAYLIIDDVKRDNSREKSFEGWMVASSPALNALEHPIYDVWVINCKTNSPE
ncbi:DUF2155 domain-containing protein [Kordiimonas sp. SCSIO 12610]|uniref:DUF2155 domain-containing protein n=1 Tax=Kordiimonas sp. SCSIO 12610 TaxID=2829597 RepID=UPI00210C2C10|nr:DUF2155 domain-containing protein [Kordiimonas sp. SCSIO 12610]UTW53835.1 DUF2155 domain-containing protein [Kordiimonas sp. SCSIO 12610]